jgi:hypothetical protein
MDEWIIENFRAPHINGRIIWDKVSFKVFIAESDQVGQRGGIGIPVASSVILQ